MNIPIILANFPLLRFPQFDWITWVIVGVAFGGGLLIGLFYGMLMVKKNPVIRRLGGELIGIVYDIDREIIDIVGLYSLGRQVYFSRDPYNPILVIKPTDVPTIPARMFGKPAIFVIGKRTHGFAVSPSSLAKIGLASLIINKEGSTGKESEPVTKSTLAVVKTLLKYQEKTMGTIKVNPELKIGLSIKTPEVMKAIANFITSLSLASIDGLKDSLLSVNKFMQYLRQRWGIAGSSKWINWLMMLLIIGGIFGLVFVIITKVMG